MTLTITQGASDIITAKNLRDAAGALLDPTGWAIHAVVCQYSEDGPVVATWRDDPGEGEGLAEVVDADPELDPDVQPGEKWVYLHVTPDMSTAWTWSRGVIQCKVTEPAGEQREARIIDDTIVIDPNCVPAE